MSSIRRVAFRKDIQYPAKFFTSDTRSCLILQIGFLTFFNDSFSLMMFIFKNWLGSPLSFMLAFVLSLLELLVAALQAYIFTMLSALYFGSAVEEHDHH